MGLGLRGKSRATSQLVSHGIHELEGETSSVGTHVSVSMEESKANTSQTVVHGVLSDGFNRLQAVVCGLEV